MSDSKGSQENVSKSEGAPRDPRTYAIIGAAMEVHNQLGCGFLEPVYQEAMELELSQRKIPFKRQLIFPIFYKSIEMKCTYRGDFVVFDNVVVELKALQRLTTLEHSQIINYLKASELPIGLLINFGARKLEFQRFILTSDNSVPYTHDGILNRRGEGQWPAVEPKT